VLPPLRERRDDIPRLVRHFAQKVARRMGRRIETIPADALDVLGRYHWPGNIRELENVIERAVILSPGPELSVNLADLNAAVPPSNGTPVGGGVAPSSHAAVTLADAEREHILGVLNDTGWVLGGPNGAAARLAMKRTTLQSKMKKLGIVRPQ
jgi:formate hydrogenlyase transcriptional activator